MPGILPMKVIKVGSSTQTRIAQACDRCRSKKIRCDGIRPSCTQCINVGFECKTSDKLSRRAFPRGYTESLEERVRALEAEVRDLKALLDEKDEKIDMLSRMHSQSRRSTSSTKTAPSPPPTDGNINQRDQLSPDPDDLFKVMQSPVLLDGEDSDAYFVGTSSGRTLIDAFKQRTQQKGQTPVDVNTDAFFQPQFRSTAAGIVSPDIVCWKAPARIVSDQLINIFFQEWAPLYPVLHRPTFLILYEEYVSCPEVMEDKKSLAQLNLVFGIAAQSIETRNTQDIETFEAQWQAALEYFIMESSMATLQCLILAQIYCLQKADYARLLKYKGLAVSLSHRLGLHQSQKRFALGALTSETRKKVFWTLYTLDCFSAAQLGLPRLIADEDVHCEYPFDADDEYVTEKGFLPSLPGEFTKLSSALALFKAARVLAKVLKENYPAASSHEISFRKIMALSDELEEWYSSLAAHLRLQFVQDKPSTKVISSRSPLLSLAYQYIRSLIYRPAVCASSAIGDKASSASVALAGCSKHVVQIVQLLEERRLSFSFCLNKHELLILSGFGLLFQGLDLNRNGAWMKDNSRLITAISEILDRALSPASVEFRRVSASFTYGLPNACMPPSPSLSRSSSDHSTGSVDEKMLNAAKQMKAFVSKFASAINTARSELNQDRRATPSTVSLIGQQINRSQVSLASIKSEPSLARSESAVSPDVRRLSMSPMAHQAKVRTSCAMPYTNLDYLSFGNDSVATVYAHKSNNKPLVTPTNWGGLLSSLDSGETNLYDTNYGGAPTEAILDMAPLSANAGQNLVWSPDLWALGNELGSISTAQPPQSVLSFSDESLTSGDDFADLVPSLTASSEESYRGIAIPDTSPYSCSEGIGLTGLDGNFGL